MTTEIAIMNKSAIALAADSAVTIRTQTQTGSNHKVLNSANKLFSLSKHAPVGLMVYGNANLLEIPWETIVKMYRNHIGRTHFDTCQEYCHSFFAFLDDFDTPEDNQQEYVETGAWGLFCKIKQDLDSWVEQQIAAATPPSPKDTEDKLDTLILSAYNKFLDLGKQSVLSNTKRQSLRRRYRSTIREMADHVFEKLPLSSRHHSQLLTVAINAASVGPMNQSGVVIAGFGETDLYPSCYSFDVAAIFAGTTIKRDGQVQNISNQNRAAIIPFAQSDDVKTFMEGIGPSLGSFLNTSFKSILLESLPNQLTEEVVNKLGLSSSQKTQLQKITQNMCKGAHECVFREFRKHQLNNYVQPIVQATGFLNTAELAAMAETLVNLVSFRKQVSMETETVGGPIDVAIITKGDGLVWIKRKHYFPAELNHHFFGKYSEGVTHEKETR